MRESRPVEVCQRRFQQVGKMAKLRRGQPLGAAFVLEDFSDRQTGYGGKFLQADADRLAPLAKPRTDLSVDLAGARHLVLLVRRPNQAPATAHSGRRTRDCLAEAYYYSPGPSRNPVVAADGVRLPLSGPLGLQASTDKMAFENVRTVTPSPVSSSGPCGKSGSVTRIGSGRRMIPKRGRRGLGFAAGSDGCPPVPPSKHGVRRCAAVAGLPRARALGA